MTQITYEVVKHDGGWAYKVGQTISESFASHDEARIVAKKAATEHELSGIAEEIEYQTGEGEWQTEHADGSDRPTTVVSDKR